MVKNWYDKRKHTKQRVNMVELCEGLQGTNMEKEQMCQRSYIMMDNMEKTRVTVPEKLLNQS